MALRIIYRLKIINGFKEKKLKIVDNSVDKLVNIHFMHNFFLKNRVF